MDLMRFSLSQVIAAVLAVTISGQVTEQDKLDAAEQGKAFIQQFRRTPDLRVLMPKFFARDFLQGVERDGGHNTLVLLEMSPQHSPKLNERERTRYYIASTNFAFMAWLYNCWKQPSHEQDADEIVLPAGVRRILRRTPLLRLLVYKNPFEGVTDAQAERMLLHTTAEVSILTLNLERMNVQYRRSLIPLKNVSDAAFTGIIAKCHDSSNDYEVQMASCNDKGDCPGVPKGQPLIGVRTPIFDFADFARIDGRMKIVRLFLSDESLTGK